MKQTLEEAAKEYANDCRNRQRHCESYCIVDFIAGADWQSNQSPWISVKERLPEKIQRVLVGFLRDLWKCDKYSEYIKCTDVFTYEDGWWIDKSINIKDINGCFYPITKPNSISQRTLN